MIRRGGEGRFSGGMRSSREANGCRSGNETPQGITAVGLSACGEPGWCLHRQFDASVGRSLWAFRAVNDVALFDGYIEVLSGVDFAKWKDAIPRLRVVRGTLILSRETNGEW